VAMCAQEISLLAMLLLQDLSAPQAMCDHQWLFHW
jgi:hypothetical protein